MRSYDGAVIKGHLDMLLLAILESEPSHGYKVVQQLKVRSGSAFDLAEGTVYPALHRLESEGLLKSGWETKGGKRRRTYKITRQGKAALSARREDWKGFAEAVSTVIEGGA